VKKEVIMICLIRHERSKKTGFTLVDGTSKSCLLSELRAGLVAYDSRGVWALGNPGSSSMWMHGGIAGDDFGPNCLHFAGDDTLNCQQIQDAYGGRESLAGKGMGCWAFTPPTNLGESWLAQGTARSMHQGGVLMSMADGSVRWITDNIQVLPSDTSSLSVWDRLMLSADGQVGSVDAM